MAEQFVSVGKNEFNVPINEDGLTELLFNDIQAISNWHDQLVDKAATRMAAALGIDYTNLPEHTEGDKTGSKTFWYNLADLAFITQADRVREGTSSELRAYLTSMIAPLKEREGIEKIISVDDLERAILSSQEWEQENIERENCLHPNMQYTGTDHGGSHKGEDRYTCKCGYGEYRS